jgi:hypothetical protein
MIVTCTYFCQFPTALSLRLQGPSGADGSGRLEVYYSGQWGTICDRYWSINDAKVACRQLGYADAVRALRGSQVPDGSGKIWLGNLYCTGREESLSSCSRGDWGVHNCQHSNDVGVECSLTGIII